MFTGLIEEVGTLTKIVRGDSAYRVSVASKMTQQDMVMGESIAVNGTCVTVVGWDAHTFDFDAGPETMKVTTLGEKAEGMQVHLERAMALGDRLGGHLVSGHVDAVGTVIRTWNEGNARHIEVQAPPEVQRLVVPKGSITIDGVSLTVNALVAGDSGFRVTIVPHTMEVTLLHNLRAGDRVNLESDLVGKYIERLTQGYRPSGSVTESLLREHGYMK